LRIKLIPIVCIILFTQYSCADKKYYSADAVVVDIIHRHWGKGYYKVDVYYRYFNGQDSVISHATSEGMFRAYTSNYFIGDSLKIGYNPKDNDDTFISEKYYVHPERKI
jgi:hypothetical protein